MGNLVFQAALGGQVALSGPNTASSFTVSVPAVTGNMVTTGDTGTVTSTMISGPLTSAVGGTGVNNGTNTLTMAGNVTHAGAFARTITATAATSVTLPTSGTLISSVTALGGAVTGTPSSSTYLRGDGTWAAAGTGTVTSVGMTVPSFLSVSGSPVTTSGTLAVSLSGTALPTANGGTGLTSAGTSGNVLTSNGTAWVSSAPSPPTTYGAIGTYVIAFIFQTALSPGTTTAGSNLYYLNTSGISSYALNGPIDGATTGAIQFLSVSSVTSLSLSGTWRAMTYSSGTANYSANLFLRIS